jgi:hypothetical protein
MRSIVGLGEDGRRPCSLVAGAALALVLLPLTARPALGASDVAVDLIGGTGVLGYALVFLLAATPWLEILVVIPIAVGLGLDPVGVAVLAFLGNVLPIYGIVVGYDRVRTWLERRRGSDESGRHGRARRLWDRYGLPGLALASPILTGVHLAALIALAAGSPKRSVGAWMTASVAVWTVVLTLGSFYGLGFVTGLG